MITATKIFTFDAAHFLQNHPGACKNLHGHQWELEVTIAKDPQMPVNDNNPPDMVLDFSELKQTVNEFIIDLFDHTCFNNNPFWPSHLRPTAENMVEYFAKRLIKGAGLNLVKLRLWETRTSYVTWTAGNE